MSEKQEIKRTGASAVKNSGRSRGTNKGDAILEPFLVDFKEYSESFSVSRKNWAKICTDAIKNGRRQPALGLVLSGDDRPVRLWVISDDMFKEMREAWLDKHES
jgi:hypothetical protein